MGEPSMTSRFPSFQNSKLLVLVILCFMVIPSRQQPLFTSGDLARFRQTVTSDLSSAVREVIDDVLQPGAVTGLWGGGGGTEAALSEGDVRQMFDELLTRVNTRFTKTDAALERVKIKLEAYFQSPRPARSGSPRLVTKCCSPPVPGSLAYHYKLGVGVNTRSECFARDAITQGLGFDLWAEDALDLMKDNFAQEPGILWQEVGTSQGLHVQYPSRSRSCDSAHLSNSKLLSSWYRARVSQKKPLNLVLVLDSGDEMAVEVQGAFPRIRHWDIVARAATAVLKTFQPGDRVSIVKSGTSVTTPLSCTDSMFDTSQETLKQLQDFITLFPIGGSPDYADAFRVAFQLLSKQQDIDKTGAQGLRDANNVILFLTNGATLLLPGDEATLLQTVATGQGKLTRPAQIGVYSIRQLFQPGLPTLLRLVDQNNQVVTVWDGTQNIRADPWTQIGVVGPVGPVGHIEIMDDTEKFGFSEIVIDYPLNLNMSYNPTNSAEMMEQVENSGTMGVTMQKVVPIPHKSTSYHGLYATVLSLTYLLNDVTSFRHLRHSYAFVVETSTGRVVNHPKVNAPIGHFTDDSAHLTNLVVVEPTLSEPQVKDILGSGTSDQLFTAKMVKGRDGYVFTKDQSGLEENAWIAHAQIQGTYLVVVMVIFHSEMSVRVGAQPPSCGGQAIYHRLDLKSSPNVCILQNSPALTEKLGISFAPWLFSDPTRHVFKDETPMELQDLQNYICNPTSGPNSILDTGSHFNDLQNDLRVLTSTTLQDIWSNTAITAEQRTLSIPTGVSVTFPAMALKNDLDPIKRQSYSRTVTNDNEVFLYGKTNHVLMSKSLHRNHRLLGVTSAKVPLTVLRAVLLSKVPQCTNPAFLCQFMDVNGNLFTLKPAPVANWRGEISHVTKTYPWLANQLLRKGAMKPDWCFSKPTAQPQFHLEYVISTPPEGISNDVTVTEDCRKFALLPVSGTNQFVLVLATRGPGHCMGENKSPGEACSAGNNGPPGPPGTLSSPRCRVCPFVKSPGPPSCQPPCFCDVSKDKCTGEIDWPVTVAGWRFRMCEEEEKTIAHITGPGPASPAVKPCPPSCTEITTQSQCTSESNCSWNSTSAYPLCLRNVQTTTTTTTTSASTKNPMVTKSTTSLPAGTTLPPGISSRPSVSFTTQRTTSTQNRTDISSNSGDSSEATPGLIAGITLAMLLILVVGVVVAWKVAYPFSVRRRRKVSDAEMVSQKKRYSKEELLKMNGGNARASCDSGNDLVEPGGNCSIKT